MKRLRATPHTLCVWQDETIVLKIFTRPMPKGRPRVGKNGNVYTPSATRAYESALAWDFRANFKQVLLGPLSVKITFLTKSRGDIDNLVKAVLDAGNGIAWADDSQIVKIEAEKLKPDDEEEIKIVIRALEGK